MNLNELRQQRAKFVHEARALHEAATAEKREMTAEENEQFDRLMAKADEKRQEVERLERLAIVEAELERSPAPETRRDGRLDGEEERAVLTFESRGLRDLDGDLDTLPEWQGILRTSGGEYRNAFRNWMRSGRREERALQVDVNTSGGYLVTPMQMVDQMIMAMDNLTYIRQWASTFAVPNADALGAVSLENDPADPTWTNELAIGSEDSTMSFGRRELRPHPLAKYIKLSKTLLRKAPNVESLVVSRLAYKFAVTMENAFLNGSGAQQPLGIFTASNDGIGTSRDVSTDNTTTAVTFDGLINAKFALKQQYWPSARWLFHSDAVKMIVKLTDGNGNYIWRESVRAGEPDRLLGMPVFMSEYAPNTFTTGLYVGVLGDFSNYWIADALDMQMERLVELYAATNQVALVGRMESDGMPVLAEAFVRVTLA